MESVVSLQELYSHPLVEELIDATIENQDLNKVKIPYVLKNKTLMSPGVWNNYFYGPIEIRKAFESTDWEDKDIRSLFMDHVDKSARQWVGEVKNPKLLGESVIGDLIIVDRNEAIKLAYGAKFGISPKVAGIEDEGAMKSFKFENFSIVINPAVKTAYINNMEVDTMEKENIEKPQEVTEELKKKEEYKYPKEGMKKKEKYPEEEKKMEDEEDDSFSEEELLDEVKLSAWTDFVKKMKGKYPKMSFKEISKAFKKKEKMSAGYKELGDDELIEVLENITQELRARKKYPYPEEEYKKKKMGEEDLVILELRDKIEELNKKLNEPEKKIVKMQSESVEENLSTEDLDRGMIRLLKANEGGI